MPDLHIETARPDDLDELTSVAARAQADADRFVAYFADEADAIGAEVTAVAGWADAMSVARRDGRAVGWLLAETETELDRVWWWGPVVDVGEPWRDVADALYSSARGRLDAGFVQEELAVDERSSPFASFAERHGFVVEEASAILRTVIEAAPADPRVAPLDASDVVAVARLHDELFPGTHTTGRQLVEPSDDLRLVLHEDGRVIGYVAAEIQADGGGYVDFLGVEPTARRRGIGRALVASALDELRRRGVESAHLTVRVGNTAARRLYRSLGFEESRIIVPYRRGFLIDG